MSSSEEEFGHKFPSSKLIGVERTIERIKNSGSFGGKAGFFGLEPAGPPRPNQRPERGAAAAWVGADDDEEDAVPSATPRLQATETPRIQNRQLLRPPAAASRPVSGARDEEAGAAAEQSRARHVQQAKRRVLGHGRHSKEYDLEIDDDDALAESGGREIANARQLPSLARPDSARASFSWPRRQPEVEQLPEKIRTLNGKGTAALLKSDVNESKRCLDEALQLVKGGHAAKHTVLEAATFNNVGRLLLHMGKTDKAAALISEAALAVAKLDLAVQDEDIADLVHAMHNTLSKFEEGLLEGTVESTDEEAEMRLAILSQFSRGAIMEHAKGALECRESMRKAAEMSRRCLPSSDPLVSAIKAAYERAKENYEIGKAAGTASFFSSKHRRKKPGDEASGEELTPSPEDKKPENAGYRRAAPSQLSWAMQMREIGKQVKEDPSFGLADDGEEKDKRKDKKDKEKKRDKKDGKENKEKKRRVHLGTDQVATEGSFGTKIKSRQHISSEENEGSNDEVIVEELPKRDPNKSFSSHTTASDRNDPSPIPNIVSDEEHSDHGLYFDNAAPIHRFPPSHLVIPHAPARTVSVDDSPVIDPDPPPRIRREPSDIEDQVVALPDQPPPLVRNVTDNDIDDDVEPAVEEDLKLDRHRSDISVVADLPDKTAGWEVKEWTSDFKNARPSSAKAKRGGGWQPEGGTIQMQDRGTDANNSATRDVLLSQRVMLPGMRDGVMRSEDLTLTSARRISVGGKQWGEQFGGDVPSTRSSLGGSLGGKQWGEQFGGDVPSTRRSVPSRGEASPRWSSERREGGGGGSTTDSQRSTPLTTAHGAAPAAPSLAPNLMNFAEIERQRLAKKAAETKQKERSTLVVQRNFRMHLARTRMLAALRAENNKAAASLQAQVKTRLARAKYAELVEWKRREAAAKRICAHARAKLGRTRHAHTLAATTLQAECRRVLTRVRWLRKLKRRRIQTKKASMLAAVARRAVIQRQYERIVAAATLQAVVRRCRTRGKYASKQRKAIRNSIKAIAAFVKRFCVRRQFLRVTAAMRLQSAARRALIRRQLLRVASATALQARVRRALARTTFQAAVKHQAQASRQAAAPRLQAGARRALARRRWVGQARAAAELGARARSMLCRHAHVHQRICAQTVQAAARRARVRAAHSGTLVGQQLASFARRRLHQDHYAQQLSGGRRLAAVPRSVALRAVLRRHTSAVRLQAVARALLDRSKWGTQAGAALRLLPEQMAEIERQKKDQDNYAARIMQSAVRRALVLSAFAGQRKAVAQTVAARRVQAAVRMERARSKHARRVAAIPLAARLRMGMLRRAYRRFVAGLAMKAQVRRMLHRNKYRRQLAARTLQASVRRIVRRSERDQRGDAGRVIASRLRRVVAARRYAAQRDAAVALQAASRRRTQHANIAKQKVLVGAEKLQARLRMQHARTHWLAVRTGAEQLQAAARAKVGASLGVDQLDRAREAAAAQRIQAASRRARMRELYCKAVGAMVLKARAHANLFRDAYAKRVAGRRLGARVRAAECRRKHARWLAACTVQASVRRLVCGRDKDERGSAHTILACCAKRAIAAAAFRRKHAASVRIQAACRRRRLAGGVQAEAERGALSLLQAQVRRRAAVQRMANMRDAARTLQATCLSKVESSRGGEERENVRKVRAEQRLQAACRMQFMRSLYCKAIAAVRLKALAHAHLNRGRYIQRVAGLLLGARIKAAACRRKYRKEVAAMLLQAHVRRLVANGQRGNESDAGCKLSTMARGRVQASVYGARLLAVVEVQAAVRRKLCSGELVRMAASVLQTCVRRTARTKELVDKRGASQRLQAAVRCKIESSRGEEDREAARRNRAASIVQAACRRQPQRAKYAREVCAVALQARFRARFARKDYSGDLSTQRFYAAVRLLQACVRRLLNHDPDERNRAGSTLASSARRLLKARAHHEQRLAAMLLEAAMRRKSADKVVEERRVLAGIEEVQARVRMSAALRRAQEQRTAAQRLQAAVRRHLGVSVGMEEAARNRAAAELQARVRRRKAQRGYLPKLSIWRYHEKIRRLQACIRRLLAQNGPDERIEAARIIASAVLRTLRASEHSARRGAAIEVQAAMRRELEVSRREQEERWGAVERLQASVRHRRAAQAWRQRCAAAACLEGAVRRRMALAHFREEMAAKEEEDRREGAEKIASMALAKVKAEAHGAQRIAAVSLQAAARSALAKQHRADAQKQADAEQRRAALERAQAYVRMSRAHRELRAQREAAQRLQAAARGKVAGAAGGEEVEKARQVLAAQRLQGVIRMLRMRPLYAKVVGSVVLKTKARRALYRHKYSRDIAVRVLQACIRRLVGSGERDREIAGGRRISSMARARVRAEQHAAHRTAASTLEAGVRRVLARGRADDLQNQTRLERLQAHMRMLAARGELGSRRSAAVTLQAAVRAKVGAQAGEEERRKQAARRLQASARMLRMRELYSKVVGALVLKTKAYGMLTRRWYVLGVAGRQLGAYVTRAVHRNEYVREVSVRALQARVRRLCVHGETGRLNAARAALCSHAKRMLASRAHAQQRAAVLTAQACVRRALAARDVVSQRDSACRLQACVRRQQVGGEHARRSAAALGLAMMAKRTLAACAFQHQRASASALQAAVRRSHASEKRARERAGIWVLQASVRRSTAHGDQDRQTRAARRLQAAARRTSAAEKHALRRTAAQRIEAAERRCRASRGLVEQREASRTLQACVRRRRAADDARDKHAGQKLASAARGALGRRGHGAKRSAAVELQAALRRRLQAGTLGAERAQKQTAEAALELQAAAKRALARAHHCAVVSAAAKLQDILLAKTIRADFCQLQEEWAAHRLQCAVRRMLAARRLQEQREAAQVLQAHVLACMIYAEVQELRRIHAAERLQAAVRRTLDRAAWRAQIEAASLLQGVLLGRLIFHEIRDLQEGVAAITLQAAVRRMLDQSAYADHLRMQPEPEPEPEPPKRSETKKELKYNPDDISDDSDDGGKKKKKKEKKKKKDKDELDPQAYGAMTPIEAAFRDVKFGKYRAVEKALLDGVVAPNTKREDFKENTLLTTAALNGQTRIAKLLLRNKADIFHKNQEGLTAAQLAYRFNYKDLGDYLVEKEKLFADQRDWVHYGAITEGEVAFRDCQHGKYRQVESALDQGHVTVGTQHYHKKNTLLHVAAVNGHLRLVKLCLRRNAPMNLQNEEGNTAAHLAFLFNYKEVAEYLVSKGAKTNIPNNQGQTCEQMLETDVPELERS